MNALLMAVAGVLLVPIAVLCVECLMSLFPRVRRKSRPFPDRPPLAVLIPAHNEEAILAMPLQSLLPQLRAGDRIVVVADNCTDGTAAVARQHGVTVIERTDRKHRGKGYALDYGVKYLAANNPPEIVIMVDADCFVHDGALDALARQAVSTGRPAQAVYLVERPKWGRPRDLVSTLAFLVKNWVRPYGLHRMRMPCLLNGTGMAFPWKIIHGAKLASSNIVEDMQLGIDLAIAGHAPVFCPMAHVTGQIPRKTASALAQRKRWEHGHLQTLATQAPRLLKAGLKQRRIGLIALALELAVPPLSLLMMFEMVMGLGLTLAGAAGASWSPALLLWSGCGAVALSIMLAWAKFGRVMLPVLSVLAAPLYVMWKLPLYLTFFLRRQREWVRTDRAGSTPHKAPQLDWHEPEELLGPSADVLPLVRSSRVDLGGVMVHALTGAQCVRLVLDQLSAGQGGTVLTPNLDNFRQCRRDAEYARLLASADLVLADGMGLMFASRLQGTPLPAVITGTDLMWELSGAAAMQGRSVFLVGDEAASLDVACHALRQRYRDLRLAGSHCVTGDVDTNAPAMQELASALSAAEPDIVFLALGSPRQERTIEHLRDLLPGAWWLGVGASFGLSRSELRLPPMWVRRNGLEWMHRIYQKPDSVGRRYFIDGLPFAASLLGGAAVRGFMRRLAGPGRIAAGANGNGHGNGNGHSNGNGANGHGANGHGANGHGKNGNGKETIIVISGGANGNGNGNGNGKANGNGKSLLNTPMITSPSRNIDVASPGAQLVYQSFVTGFASVLSGTYASAGLPASVSGGAQLALAGSVLRQLRAVVLLGGAVRPSHLSIVTGRSILDLPFDDGRSILCHWQDAVAGVRRLAGLSELPMRVLVDNQSLLPTAPPPANDVVVCVERDASEYRGTGGVLRDLAEDYADEEFIFVANAAQALLAPLPELATLLAGYAGANGNGKPPARWDVSLLTHDDGTPCGLMLVRCAALRVIAAHGYVDLKEQGLPLIATQFAVRHVSSAQPTAMPIRSFAEYMPALSRLYCRRLNRPEQSDPLAEEHRPTFAIVEQGATIDPRARIHDSVILRGASVEADAVLVRSVVCPGACVAAGQMIVDQLVTAARVKAGV